VIRRVATVLVVLGVLVAGSVPPFVAADQPASEIRCELSQPGDFSCGHLVAVAGTAVPIPDGSIVRVVDAVGGPFRTSPDIALVVISTPGAPTRLVLVGYVGIDIEPQAWIPDRTEYAAWYAKYGGGSAAGPTAAAWPPELQRNDTAAGPSIPTMAIVLTLVAAGIGLFFAGVIFGRRQRPGA
jgi:hypothetical protein